jgi:cytochrome oxidase Cu insertion factor (SCO1/SenC/PrrC family)
VIGRGWIAAAVIGLGVLLVACGDTQEASSTGSQSAGRPVVEVGDKAPHFSLPSASGANVSLADYQGQKPVLLYFSMGPG